MNIRYLKFYSPPGTFSYIEGGTVPKNKTIHLKELEVYDIENIKKDYTFLSYQKTDSSADVTTLYNGLNTDGGTVFVPAGVTDASSAVILNINQEVAFTIDLGSIYDLGTIKAYLYSGDSRAYKFQVLASTDNTTFEKVWDNTNSDIVLTNLGPYNIEIRYPSLAGEPHLEQELIFEFTDEELYPDSPVMQITEESEMELVVVSEVTPPATFEEQTIDVVIEEPQPNTIANLVPDLPGPLEDVELAGIVNGPPVFGLPITWSAPNTEQDQTQQTGFISFTDIPFELKPQDMNNPFTKFFLKYKHGSISDNTIHSFRRVFNETPEKDRHNDIYNKHEKFRTHNKNIYRNINNVMSFKMKSHGIILINNKPFDYQIEVME